MADDFWGDKLEPARTETPRSLSGTWCYYIDLFEGPWLLGTRFRRY